MLNAFATALGAAAASNGVCGLYAALMQAGGAQRTDGERLVSHALQLVGLQAINPGNATNLLLFRWANPAPLVFNPNGKQEYLESHLTVPVDGCRPHVSIYRHAVWSGGFLQANHAPDGNKIFQYDCGHSWNRNLGLPGIDDDFVKVAVKDNAAEFVMHAQTYCEAGLSKFPRKVHQLAENQNQPEPKASNQTLIQDLTLSKALLKLRNLAHFSQNQMALAFANGVKDDDIKQWELGNFNGAGGFLGFDPKGRQAYQRYFGVRLPGKR